MSPAESPQSRRHARLAHLRPAHDRRGRGPRGPLLPVAVPRYRTRSMAFDQLVLEAYAPLHNAYLDQLAGVDLAVDTIPRMRLRPDSVMPDDIVADGPVPLGRILGAGVDRNGNPTRARIIVFRMPVERRAKTVVERSEMLTWILTALVANHLNMDPRDLDPEFGW
ncbi:metallopeptidase family protein [Corynebacterium sanguinis]|uniref:metallopeptidase family protein n=1 Tax=Corynebacterium sanguinis TaxID=2594913 RepID=UPI001184F8BC|nr:metallopeptidase family protein [Corynebacterium sanguinis]MCT1613809.1 metallopeptidase family protein [Corynebacterium sanguinis]MCT1805309.1 metallopeptidase family protein [Corynebacterium sanguinis]MCT2158864.1 metallopeptidase family protein [Corynebacterium sanguinis]MCT2251680.1 metallopeptidase family protein [Corynebacterium sanguinis]MCT2288208.1 metallopeptidase family protein [Corynebacterium sanguinis]